MSLLSKIGRRLVKTGRIQFCRPSVVAAISSQRSSYSTMPYQYETLNVITESPFVYNVEMNRPEKSNAMNRVFWSEIIQCFEQLGEDSDCRVVLLTGAGKNFTAGLDIVDFAQDFFSQTSSDDGRDVARKAMDFRKTVKSVQYSFTAIEKCPKPVIAVVHGACIGGGVDMISACDVRHCSSDAFFQIKEVDLGLMADVGTLQRLPKVIGNDSLLRELVYTARKFYPDEALSMGMVSKVSDNKESAKVAALKLANVIASKSPVAVQGSKVNMNYSRDHPVENALDYAAVWNSAMLQTEDILKAVQGSVQKETPIFAKL